MARAERPRPVAPEKRFSPVLYTWPMDTGAPGGMNNQAGGAGRAFALRSAALLGTIGAIWLVSILAFGSVDLLRGLAVTPRATGGLLGVVAMPFVHDSLSHLWANTVPLLGLGAITLFRGVGYYIAVCATIIVLNGAAVWLLARDALHVGASGLVFGLAAFLVVRGLYERRPGSAAVALLVFVVYGSMIWGVLPHGDGVSWEAHLFGLVAGIVTARAFAAKPPAAA